MEYIDGILLQRWIITSSSAPRRSEAIVTADRTKLMTQMATIVAVQLCSSGGAFLRGKSFVSNHVN